MEASDGLGVSEVVGAEFGANFFQGELDDFDFFVPFGLGFGFGEIECEEEVDFFGEESDGGVDESSGDHGSGLVADFFDEFGTAAVFGGFVAFEFSGWDFEDGFLDGDPVLLGEEDRVSGPGDDTYAAMVHDDVAAGFASIADVGNAGLDLEDFS